CALYVAGEREPGHWHYEEALVEARRRPQAFVWLGLHEPREDELADIANTFELHELTIEDALKEFQRPKIERYGDMTFAVIRTTRYVEHTELTESSEVGETGSVSLFLGPHFVITTRTGSGGELAPVRAGRLPEVPKEIRRYFRDVTDHLTRTVEQVQTFEQLLDSILQARLAQVSVEQNDDMRKIAAWAGIAAVWTSVAGIYGMNFR